MKGENVNWGTKRYHQRKEKGLCNCGRPQWHGYSKCRACYMSDSESGTSERKKARRRATRQEREDAGLCTSCGGDRDDEYLKQCSVCREKGVAKERKRKAWTLPRSKKARVKRETAYMAAGLCRCGQEPEPGGKRCLRCLNSNKLATKRWREKQKVKAILGGL